MEQNLEFAKMAMLVSLEHIRTNTIDFKESQIIKIEE
jgi:hypothetical protein